MFLAFIPDGTLCCLGSKGTGAAASVRGGGEEEVDRGKGGTSMKFAIKEGYEVAWYRFRRKL